MPFLIMILCVIFILLLITRIVDDYTKSKCLENENKRRWNGHCQEYQDDGWIPIDPVFYVETEYN